MKSARLLVFGVAMTAGLGAAYMVMGSKPPEPVRVAAPVAPSETELILVAARDLSLNNVLAEADIRWQGWPKTLVSPNDINKSLRPNALEEVKGMIVRSTFSAGQPLRLDRLAKTPDAGYMSAALPSGARAVAIQIDDKGSTTAGNFINPNDRVDVIRTFHPDDSGPGSFATETILTDIVVRAIGQATELKPGDHVVGGITATLELSPTQAEKIVWAQKTGQLSLSLRSMADSPRDLVAPKVDQPQAMTIVRFGNASQARVR